MFRMLERGPKFEERSPHQFNFALKSLKTISAPLSVLSGWNVLLEFIRALTSSAK